MNELEREFHNACLDAIAECKRLGYFPHRWEAMVHRWHAHIAVHRLYQQNETFYEDGGDRLMRMGRTDLSVEHAVLQDKWHDLFSDTERQTARDSLEAGRWLAEHRV